jgi:hypothetical protein
MEIGNERGMVVMCELPGRARSGLERGAGGGLGKEEGTSWKEAVIGRESKGHEDLKQLEECTSSLSFPGSILLSPPSLYRKQI